MKKHPYKLKVNDRSFIWNECQVWLNVLLLNFILLRVSCVLDLAEVEKRFLRQNWSRKTYTCSREDQKRFIFATVSGNRVITL